MHIFDVLGPVMIGPSSSHTAGAVKIGYVTRKLLGEAPVQANILLHGSFADTGSGHGTDRAVVAGLLGCKPDDPQIPSSFEAAKNATTETLPASLSCGLCMCRQGESFEEYYIRADKALYYVKQNGKNNYRFYEELVEQ